MQEVVYKSHSVLDMARTHTALTWFNTSLTWLHDKGFRLQRARGRCAYSCALAQRAMSPCLNFSTQTAEREGQLCHSWPLHPLPKAPTLGITTCMCVCVHSQVPFCCLLTWRELKQPQPRNHEQQYGNAGEVLKQDGHKTHSLRFASGAYSRFSF